MCDLNALAIALHCSVDNLAHIFYIGSHQTSNKRKAMFIVKTLEGIEAIPREFLYPDDIADFMETNPQSIRVQAREDPDKLGFPSKTIIAQSLSDKTDFAQEKDRKFKELKQSISQPWKR